MTAESRLVTTDTPSPTPFKVAISASKSPDCMAFGLSDGHMKGFVSDLATYVMAADMDIAYPRDLRHFCLVELLFGLMIRYTSQEDLGVRHRITNHLAWPAHIRMPLEEVERLIADLKDWGDVVLIGMDGAPMTLDERRRVPTRTATADEWIAGLTAMRRIERSCTDARVVLGGLVAGYKGRIPGVAEEALLSLRAGQPLFVVGGFGGAARDVAETLGLAERWTKSRRNWPGQSDFEPWTGDDLCNGLSREENEALASSPFLSEVLVLRGLYRARRERMREKEVVGHG